MAAKKDIPTMVSGLGMGMRLLQLLTEKVVASGGCEEMLHFLSTDRGNETLARVAELIAQSEWRVPRSLMEQRTEKESRIVYGEDSAIYDKFFHWGLMLNKLHIPHITFNLEDGDILPVEIEQQLIGHALRYPMLVTYDGKGYILCDIQASEVGEIFDDRGSIGTVITIAETKYFDLDN